MWMLGNASNFSTEFPLSVPPRTRSYPWPITRSNVQQRFYVWSTSFSLFHTRFGRENRGAACPLQAGDRFFSHSVNPAGTRSTNVCFDRRWLCYRQNSSILQTFFWWNPPQWWSRREKSLWYYMEKIKCQGEKCLLSWKSNWWGIAHLRHESRPRFQVPVQQVSTFARTVNGERMVSL